MIETEKVTKIEPEAETTFVVKFVNRNQMKEKVDFEKNIKHLNIECD